MENNEPINGGGGQEPTQPIAQNQSSSLPNQDLYDALDKQLRSQEPIQQSPQANAQQANAPIEPAAQAPIAAEPQAPAAPTEPTKSLTDVLKEKYGWQSEEDIEKWKQSNVVEKEVERIVEKEIDLPNERLKQLVQFVKDGGKEEDFYKTQFTDWDKVDSAVLIKDALKRENPELDNEDIDLIYEKKYMPKVSDPDYLSDDEKKELRLAKISLDIEAKKIREQRKQEQVKILETAPAQKTQAEIEEEAKIQTFRKEWEVKAPKAVSELNEISFDIEHIDDANEKTIFKSAHKVNAEVKAIVEDIVKDPRKLISLFVDKDGNVDANKLARGVYFNLDPDRIVKEIASQHAANVQEQFIQKNLKNANFKQMPVRTNGGANPEQKLAEDYLNSFPGRRM